MNTGNVAVDETVYAFMYTYDSTGASADRSVAGTVQIYKDGTSTPRASSAGITDTGVTAFNSVTGMSLVTIDLSDNTDAGFYAAGSDYEVIINGATLDGQTVNLPVCKFSIENRYAEASLAAATLTSIAQAVLTYNAETDVATMPKHSLATIIFAMLKGDTSSGTSLLVYDHNDVLRYTIAITTSASANPITVVG